MGMTSRRKRRLPAPPDDVDTTSASIVPPLLEAFVMELGDEYSAPAEGLIFRDLLDAAYPAAWKEYQELHWKAHFGAAIESVQSEITYRAKRQSILRTARRNAAQEAGEAFVDDDLDDNPIFKVANSVGRGWQKRIMARTRPELLTIASRYEAGGNQRLLMAAYNRELAKRLNDDEETVADRWTPEEVVDLFAETFGDES